jgi:5S rRNA maturation endonuclease (ribonuclease M5)
MRKLSIRDVGRALGLDLPPVGKKGKCPFRKHKRKDKTFRVFRAKGSGDELWKCWSCDPPDNVGDAIGLYARHENVDRTSAIEALKKQGFEGPTGGRPPPYRPSRSSSRPQRPTCDIPVTGTNTGPFLSLDIRRWRAWRSNGSATIEDFARTRRIRSATMREHDVVEVDRDVVGFGYRDPDTLVPCRVKVRPLKRKAFWIEPRCKDPDSDARARSPLYLAHELPLIIGPDAAVVIVEGEVDALTIKDIGIQSVVSLPDGDASAGTVNIEPIAAGYRAWLVATDLDDAGHEAYLKLRKRAWPLGIEVARVRWCKLVEQETGEELVQYKDANEARVAGDFSRADFERCFAKATEEAWGCALLP